MRHHQLLPPVLAAFFLLAAGVPGFAYDCGDVTGDGDGVKASDALGVLQTAVGLDVGLQCQTGDCIALEPRVQEVERATLYAYDGDGNLLGSLAGLERNGNTFAYSVWIRTLGRLAMFIAQPDPFTQVAVENAAVSLGAARYQALDCQGDPIFAANVGGALNHVFVATEIAAGPKFVVFDQSDVHLGMVATASRFNDQAPADCENIILSTGDSQYWATPTVVTLPFPTPTKGPLTVAPGAP